MRGMKPAGSFGRAPRKDIFESASDPNIVIVKFSAGADTLTSFGKAKRQVHGFGHADRSLLLENRIPSIE